MTQMKSISNLTHEAEKSFSTSFLKKFFSSKSSHFYELVPTHVHSFLNRKAKFFFIQSPCHQMTP